MTRTPEAQRRRPRPRLRFGQFIGTGATLGILLRVVVASLTADPDGYSARTTTYGYMAVFCGLVWEPCSRSSPPSSPVAIDVDRARAGGFFLYAVCPGPASSAAARKLPAFHLPCLPAFVGS